MTSIDPALSLQPESHFFRRHGEAVSTALCGLLAVGGWLVDGWGAMAPAILLYVASYMAGGYRSARAGLRTLVRERELDVDLLMSVAAIGAAAIGHWSDGAVLIFIFSFSGTLESYATARSQRELTALMRIRPERARLLRNGDEIDVAAADLQVGDWVLVRPGERLPADGEVQRGTSAVNQSPITGESMPVEKGPGDSVFAGTVNGEGALQVAVTSPPESSLIARIVRLVERATAERPAAQLFIERFERGYARVVVVGALVAVLAPPLLLGWTWETAFYRGMVFLVVASPCALVVAMMPTLLSGIANAARHGVLIKGGGYLEAIGNVQVMAFDKTGTLTLGTPELTDVVALDGDHDGLLAAVAGAEALSEHPLAWAVVAGARHQGIAPAPADDLQTLPGQGLRALVSGQVWWVGTAALMAHRGYAVPEELVALAGRLRAEGKTVMLAADTAVRGLVAVRDTIRPEAWTAIKLLRQLGMRRLVMITGDSAATAHAIGAELGLDEIHADVLPEQKVEIVNQLTRRYGRVAMVGDGINDAPALAAATVGIAMGRGGTAVALEVADIVLMADELLRICYAVRLGRRAIGLIRQNLALAIGVIVALVVANFAGSISLPLGVLGHEGSTVLVTLNGLRMLRRLTG